MIKTLEIKNFTVFPAAKLHFSPELNVIVGENGAGKTHLLKLAYSVVSADVQEYRRLQPSPPVKSALQTALARKLLGVFRPDKLGRLARRKPGRERCEIDLKFHNPRQDVAFIFATNSTSEVNVRTVPSAWISTEPAYLPTRELLSIYPNFVSIYENYDLGFEETWKDTCLLLGKPLRRGPTDRDTKSFLDPLEDVMDGAIELDPVNGHFYFNNSTGRMEVSIVAEGWRKLGMLTRLIANGSLLGKGCLFWDEPEANLNPRLIKIVASSIVQLSKHGIQVFIATHSLFLLRELEILARKGDSATETHFFGLHRDTDGVRVDQGESVDDIGDIVALDEELKQSDRFLKDVD